MTNHTKPVLEQHLVNRLITEVDASDTEQARTAIAEAVQTAERQWISAPIIADALAQELLTIAQRNLGGRQIAGYLRALAEAIETQTDLH